MLETLSTSYHSSLSSWFSFEKEILKLWDYTFYLLFESHFF